MGAHDRSRAAPVAIRGSGDEGKMLTASMGNSEYEIDEETIDRSMVTLRRRNGKEEVVFYVPRELLEAYAVRRMEEVGKKLLRELMGNSR